MLHNTAISFKKGIGLANLLINKYIKHNNPTEGANGYTFFIEHFAIHAER